MGRSGVTDTTSLGNIGEEHLTPVREGSDVFASNRFGRSCSKRSPARDVPAYGRRSFLPIT